jgi:simple sugar transport system permease protein
MRLRLDLPVRLEPRGAQSALWAALSPVLALLLTVIGAGAIFAVLGRSPGAALYTFLVAPLLTPTGVPELFVKAAPLILIGVGLALGFRANVWNIGAEGQFNLGAVCGGALGLAFPDAPAAVLFPAMMVAGALGGMALAAVPAWLRTRFNANEILTSLMLSYVMQLALIYLVTGPLRDPQGYGFPQSALFSDAATAPILIEGTRVHLGVLVALLAAVGGWLFLDRSVAGYALRVLGQAPRAARFAGFAETRLVWLALLVSGGLSGLAGLFEVAGPIGQLLPRISPGYGFTAIIVAFLGRLHPLGVIPAALVLALSYLGGDAAQIDLKLPSAVTGIFQGVLLFFLLACDVLILYRVRLVRRDAAAAS